MAIFLTEEEKKNKYTPEVRQKMSDKKREYYDNLTQEERVERSRKIKEGMEKRYGLARVLHELEAANLHAQKFLELYNKETENNID